ncbi:MAG: hypothetical protein RL375_4488 [Pseudomonadota bacterium]|jgi:hypothetical protein
MKQSLLAIMALAAAPAFAAPFLRADVYPFPAVIPQSNFTFTATAVPGPFSLPCTVVAGAPQCDAAPALAVQVPLVTFVMTVKRTAGCDATGANCWTAGEASSIPFERRLLDQPVGVPIGLKLAP